MLTLEKHVTSRVKDWLRPHVRPRRFHAFCVGAPKTGTHSLAGVFSRYRAWHEPLLEHFSQLVMARANGELCESAAREQIRRLDRRMWLEFNASYINYFVLDLLLEEHPRAKFVLTIRDCYSWLDSMFNELLGRTHSEVQLQFNRWYLNSLSPAVHQDGDRVLAERGLWPLDSWLRAWNHHNSRILESIPRERLLIMRTPDIRRDIPRLADFLGIPADTLDAGRSHEHKAAAKFGLLSKIDENYLHACVAERCGDLMKRFFPEIRGLSDVPGFRSEDAASAAMAS
jgi:sulfotransferase family protein